MVRPNPYPNPDQNSSKTIPYIRVSVFLSLGILGDPGTDSGARESPNGRRKSAQKSLEGGKKALPLGLRGWSPGITSEVCMAPTLTFDLYKDEYFTSLQESVGILCGKLMQVFYVAIFIWQVQHYCKVKWNRIYRYLPKPNSELTNQKPSFTVLNDILWCQVTDLISYDIMDSLYLIFYVIAGFRGESTTEIQGNVKLVRWLVREAAWPSG